MIAHDARSRLTGIGLIIFCLVLHILCPTDGAQAINITVYYRYSNGFFNTQEKIDALKAAADRYSAIITTSLSAATLADNTIDPRISITHPTLGTNFQVSSANSSASDAVVAAGGGAANEYRGPWSIAEDEWILYAGGRSLNPGVAGQGGTGAGQNISIVFTDGSSHLNRGFRDSSISGNLPVWGGSVMFDNDGSTNWHFDLNTPAPNSTVDFYSIALHEIGHALGLSADSDDWDIHSSGGLFSGPQAVATYNNDNGTTLSALEQVSASNRHWKDGTYESFIFENANPNYTGTVGPGALQDLLMEPTANFIVPTLRRFELTNVDVAALADIGWTVVPPGDYNFDGIVDVADYVVWRKNNGTPQEYATWVTNFDSTPGGGAAAGPSFADAVPEPASWGMLLATMMLIPYRLRPAA